MRVKDLLEATRTSPPLTAPGQRGFTLTELAVVLVIVALLIGGMLIPLAAQDDLRRTQESQKSLTDVLDALLGFAATNGRLPCPATIESAGFESFCVETTGQPYTPCTPLAGPNVFPAATPYRCSHPYNGFVPAATLGLAPVNSQKLLIDAWGNRIRYAVSVQSNTVNPTYDFTTPGGMSSRTLASLGTTTYLPDLKVCDSDGGIANAGVASGPVAGLADCTAGLLTDKAVAVVYSLGANSGRGGAGIDERHNPNDVPSTNPNHIPPDRVFVSHTPTPVGAPNGEFDDLVIWLSPNILFNRMIAAGQLP